MIRNFIKNYYKLLDEKLENWTIVVIIIALLIVLVSLSINYKNKNFHLNTGIQNSNIVEINWIKYNIKKI